MKIKVSNTQEAFDLIQAFDPPLEIEIPRSAVMVNFQSSIRYYAVQKKLTVLMRDASTSKAQIIYVVARSKTMKCEHGEYELQGKGKTKWCGACADKARKTDYEQGLLV